MHCDIIVNKIEYIKEVKSVNVTQRKDPLLCQEIAKYLWQIIATDLFQYRDDNYQDWYSKFL